MRLNVLFSGPALKNALVALAAGGLVAASCTFNPGPAGSQASGGTGTGFGGTGILGGAGHPGSPGAGGSSSTGVAGSGVTPSPDGANCGLQQYGLQNVPPDLLIVLDKSGSMGNQPDDTTCPRRGAACETKWADMTAGINMVVGQTDTTIRWGLKYFANNNSCAVNPDTAVPVAANNAMAVTTSIAGTTPGGSTPTRLGVSTGAMYLQALTDPNPKYILLATDGEPNCAPGMAADADDTAGAVQAVMDSATAGIPVFVVGVGNVATAQATLDMMAVAGGRPQSATTPKYYPVANTADLVSVLTKIGGQITTCSFGLGKAPPVPGNIGVYANPGQVKIPKDPSHANGWDYGAGMTSIELFGAACDDVKSKKTTDVQAIFGCPGQIIP
ncbi:MAG TPA: vWA domain-containing protein [Polyangia bacterium]